MNDETQISAMVNTIIENGAKALIDNAPWMDSTSRQNCDDKIAKLAQYVGFPNSIKNGSIVSQYYSTINFNSDNYLENLKNLLDFAALQQELLFNGRTLNMNGNWPQYFNEPSLFSNWLTGINAFYVALGNFFTIPVPISQAPYYSYEFPSSINFGGIGTIIGHEIFHGFDPQGSMYDANGNEVPQSIWTSITRQEYLQRVKCIINQYNHFEVDGVYVNGTRTQTENVADNSGIAASYLAWQQWRQSVSDPKLPGIDFTDEQLFFVGWARSWCNAVMPGYYVGSTDTHSPDMARVWGTMQNSPYFASAFNCPVNSRMNPTNKCELWQ